MNFNSSSRQNVEKRLQSEEDFEIFLVNKLRGTGIPINVSNPKNGPVDIQIVLENDDCVLKEK